jgi:Citrate lyase beta subunit
MKYLYNDIDYVKQPEEFNKFTRKEVLQYAISGLLYMPATKIEIADKIISKQYSYLKAICLDLEDSVGEDGVEEAEYYLEQILRKLKDNMKLSDLPLIFIRVRSPKQLKKLSETFDKDLFKIITGFNFPKFDSTNCVEYLKNFYNLKSNIKTPLYIMPIIESSKVMDKQSRLKELYFIQRKLSPYSEDVLNIRVGATDFCNIFGLRRNETQTIYDINVVTDCFIDIINTFGKNYVIAGPVWEYFDSNGTVGPWLTGLKKELELDKVNGFIGKTSIHPTQLEYIAKNNIVNNEDYQDAINILGMNKGLIGVAKSSSNNKMNEVKTHSNWAKKIIGLSEVYGVKKC